MEQLNGDPSSGHLFVFTNLWRNRIKVLCWDGYVYGLVPSDWNNPIDYLKNLFTCLPAARITRIKEFTPAAWFKAKAKEQESAQAA